MQSPQSNTLRTDPATLHQRKNLGEANMFVFSFRSHGLVGSIIAITALGWAQEQADHIQGVKLPYYSLVPSKLIWLITKPGIQKELGIDEAESQKLLASLRSIDRTNVALQTPEEKKQRTAAIVALNNEMRRGAEEAISKSISEDQLQRFQQLQLQVLGSRALVSLQGAERLARQLSLTAEQRERLKKVQEDFRAKRLSAITEEYEADLVAVLTPEQTIRWNEMMGTPFQMPKSYMGNASWEMIYVPEVQKELGLNEDEVETLVQALAVIRNRVIKEKGQEAYGSNRDGNPPGDRSRRAQELVATVKSSLTIAQWNRLQELILQEAGLESLDHPDVATKVELTLEQRERVHTLIREFMKEGFGGAGTLNAPMKWETRQLLQRKLHADLLELLTMDQKKIWEAMQGAKVDDQLLGKPTISATAK